MNPIHPPNQTIQQRYLGISEAVCIAGQILQVFISIHQSVEEMYSSVNLSQPFHSLSFQGTPNDFRTIQSPLISTLAKCFSTKGGLRRKSAVQEWYSLACSFVVKRSLRIEVEGRKKGRCERKGNCKIKSLT